MKTSPRIHLRPLWLASATGTLALLSMACGANKATLKAPDAPNALGPSTTATATRTPNTPTASNVSVSEEILRACGISDADAYFPFDSASVTSRDRTPLDAVASCFTRGPLKGRAMQLIGHADPRGSSDYNMTLGQSRADAVASYLTTRGLSRSVASSTSRGAMDATGNDESGWARDRRVDVTLRN